jgi:formylglycine-generating enzyme required for sulfatase activity
MSVRRFGILIASSRFPDEPKLEDLRFPENDVDGLNEILTSKDHGQFTQTFVLKNKLHHEILLKINQILRDADRNDLVLIYYSGHGKLNPAGRLHLTSTDTVINALEATSIPVSTIKDYVDISSSNKIVLILDCCFSGAAGEAFARGGVDDQLHLVSGGRGTYILTASTGIQMAQEKESDQFGVFTKHVIEGIKSGEADLDSDGRITMGELYRYVHDRVLDEGFQEPMKWDLNVRGEMVISRSSRTPWTERRKKILKILYDLAAEGILPDDILDKARQVISLEPDQLKEEDRTYDRLLDQLLKNRLEPVEFIRKWDKVRPEKPDLQIKEQKELKRKAEEEKRRKEEEGLKRKTVEEHKKKEAETKRKAEEERKKKEIEANRKIKEERKQKEAEAKRKEVKEEPIPGEPPGISRALKFGVLIAATMLITIVGFWLYSQQQLKEVRQEIEKFDRLSLNLANAISEIDKPEQIEELYRQRDTLSLKVEGFSEQAAKAGLGLEMEELQKRLKQVQIQLANKEKELFTTRRGKLFVAAVPDNAVVKILNINQRFRPGMELEPGKYHVEVSSEGYEPQDRWIEIGPEEEKLINFELKKITPKVAWLHVETIPKNASVKIMNIIPKFVPGMELEPGSYDVEVAAVGFESQRRWVDLVAGHEEPFRFELAKIKVAEPTPPPKDRTNSIGMKFVLIPAGKFVMGSPPEEPGRDDDERQYEVKISKPFYIQTTEVSQGQWKRVMGNNPSNFKNCGDECPVESVSWGMAKEFISKLNQMEGTNKYRLPTEAEWEYACRAGTETAYSFDEVDKLGKYAWYSDNSKNRTHPVGRKKPNAWGLFDMHGNVWEWCQDWYGDYPSSSVADPKGSTKGKYRVKRGGSWGDNVWYLRSADRDRYDPGARGDGFRVVRDF